MNKIILFLALLSLGVSKAQVVGGYLPLNSTKSATMGGLRVNGTSTFTGNALFSSSVGIGALPTSSLSSFQLVKGTGSLNIGSSDGSGVTMWGNVTPSTSNYLIYSNGASSIINGTTTARLSVGGNEKVYCTSSGVKINSSSTPNSALDVNGSIIASGTFSLGSANLTGGNTGTVAVLSDAVFAVTLGGGLLGNPADGSTYYHSNLSVPFTQQGHGKLYFPYNVTLVGWSYTGYITSVASSSESSTLSINIDNSATNLNTAITYSVAGGINTYSAGGLSISVNANSYVEAKLVNPTWATNPAGVYSGITFWFVRRS